MELVRVIRVVGGALGLTISNLLRDGNGVGYSRGRRYSTKGKGGIEVE